MTGKIRQLPLKDVVVSGGFWARYLRIVREKMIPYQWEVLHDRVPGAARSHCIRNFEIAAGKSEGAFYGMVFQDSDLYKWLESAAYSLAAQPDDALEKRMDEAVALIGAAQSPDGYVNTYYTIKEPGRRFTNLREGHELYCAGHMIEAAVAYFRATGKRALLDIARRFADCIDRHFGPGEGQCKGYPGHQGIELALMKLYAVTDERRYVRLAHYFISQRGQQPLYFDEEFATPGYTAIFGDLDTAERAYNQAHIPPVTQRTAIGHAVRAVYMYSGMADLAAELDDAPLRAACEALYRDTLRQMYVTGAIGAAAIGERFTIAYDLPNALAYGETCASVALMMFCQRMHALSGDGRYFDTAERALYNTVLAGMSLDGTAFYYVNPLETDPRVIAANPTYRHVKPVRQAWYDCPCCPTNVARTIMSLGAYAYAESDEGLYVNLYCAGSARAGAWVLAAETAYPYGDTWTARVSGGAFALYLRDPACAPVRAVTVNGESADFKAENGYIRLERAWGGELVTLTFDMEPKRVYSDPAVQANLGKAAVMRGPLVYCAEEADNGTGLGGFILPDDAAFAARPLPEGFPDGLPPEAVSLRTAAFKYADTEDGGDGLYSTRPPVAERADLTLIPYFMWANRGENEMRVYLATETRLPENDA